MEDSSKKQMASTNHKGSIITKLEKIFNVRKLQNKHFDYDKYRKPNFSPFHHKHLQSEQSDTKNMKKGGQYNFQIAIISSTAYKELSKRYHQLKQQHHRQKQHRLKQLQEKEEELLKFEAERERLDAERQKLTVKRDEIKLKLLEIRNRNQQLQVEQIQRNEEYRMINMDYLRNMLISMRYQNGIEIDPDNMTYEELLQLQEKIGNVSKGLTKEQVAKLSKKQCQSGQVQLCSICYEDVKEGQLVIRLPCKHGFHEQCIDEWLKKQKICPNCKQQIRCK